MPVVVQADNAYAAGGGDGKKIIIDTGMGSSSESVSPIGASAAVVAGATA
jgi:hypothetical protein